MKTYILHIDDEVSLQYAEDCKTSCEQFGIECIMHEGVSRKTNRELTRKFGYKINTFKYESEYCGTIGHIEIWKRIAASDEIGVVLEHDAVAVGDYSNLPFIADGEIVFLGPRLYDRRDYNYPVGSTIDYHEVEFYAGAHAYAITPKTAQMMLDQLAETNVIQMPVDGLLGLKNKFGMKLLTVDPALVIAEVGGRHSFNFDEPSTENRVYFPKFLECVDADKLPPLVGRKFSVDWFTQNIPHIEESMALAGLDKNSRLEILEIGAFEGMSTCWFSDSLLTHTDSHIDVVDTFVGSVEHENIDTENLQRMYLNNISLSKNTEKIHTYVGDSRHFLPLFIKEDKKYDLIYVDGAHMPENIIIDGLCAFHLLKDNGVVIFDDYEWTYNGDRTVKQGLDKLEKLITIAPILTGWQRSYVKV